MAVKVTDKDLGYQRTLQVFRNLGLSLTLGVVGDKATEPHKDADGKPSGITVGELAAIHELGLGVPERSWLRAWFEANHRTVIVDVKAGLAQVVQGRLTHEGLLELLGNKYAAQIKARIIAGVDPPNAESTIQRKGSSTPLIDTGQLLSSIGYEVRRLASQAGIEAFGAAFNAKNRAG